MLKSAADRGPAATRAESACITHHGELLQGAVRSEGRIMPCLVSLPRRDRIATCRAELFESDRLEVVPPWKRKARRAARILLERCGRPHATGRLVLSSQVEAGLGLGSSTADVVAAIRACAAALGVSLSAEEVAAIAAEAELAVDPVMFERRALLFAQRSGRVLEDWGDWYPAFAVFSCRLAPPEVRIDTLSLPQIGADAELRRFAEILDIARDGFRRRDPAAIAGAATLSAALNQSRVALVRFEALRRLADECGALGVQVAHSGVVGGALLDARDPCLEDKVSALATGWRRLGHGTFDLFSTAA